MSTERLGSTVSEGISQLAVWIRDSERLCFEGRNDQDCLLVPGKELPAPAGTQRSTARSHERTQPSPHGFSYPSRSLLHLLPLNVEPNPSTAPLSISLPVEANNGPPKSNPLPEIEINSTDSQLHLVTVSVAFDSLQADLRRSCTTSKLIPVDNHLPQVLNKFDTKILTRLSGLIKPHYIQHHDDDASPMPNSEHLIVMMIPDEDHTYIIIQP